MQKLYQNFTNKIQENVPTYNVEVPVCTNIFNKINELLTFEDNKTVTLKVVKLMSKKVVIEFIENNSQLKAFLKSEESEHALCFNRLCVSLPDPCKNKNVKFGQNVESKVLECLSKEFIDFGINIILH